MTTFTYTIQDPVGIHARPAGQFVKQAKAYKSDITIERGDRSAGGKNLMKLMGLGVKCGDTITVKVDGEDEEVAAKELEAFLKANL